MMRYNDYMDFSMNQIKAFLTLFETLNYTQAAKYCFITQSTLSRNIQNMENSLGIQLFIRNTVRVIPTPAGRNLYASLKPLSDEYEKAILNTYRIQEGKGHLLTLLISDSMDIQEELLPFIQFFKRCHPDFEIRVIRDATFNTYQHFKNNMCDVAFDFLIRENEDPAYIRAEPLFTGPYYLYMLKTNPLCRKQELTLNDLASLNLLVCSPSHGSDQVSFTTRLLANIGKTPHLSYYVDRPSDLSLNIQEYNQGILADAYFIDRNSPLLESRPIQNTTSNIYFKYLCDEGESNDVQLFIKELRSFFKLNSREEKSK